MRKNRKLIPVLVLISISLSILVYLKTRNTQPGNAELELYFRAAAAYERGDFQSCLNLTTALSDKCPSFYQARLLLGKAQFFSGNTHDAEAVFEQLINDKSDYYEAEIWNLRCKLQSEKITESRIYGEELLSRSPEDPRILGILARISAAENAYQQALDYYRRAFLFEEDLAINRVDAAKIYFSLQNNQEAGVQLKKAADLAAEDSPLNSALSELIKRLGEYE